MKKTLLACSIIVSSVFFTSAQFNVGGVNYNVGKTCATMNGKPMCYDPSTGQWSVVTGNGIGVGGNTNTGAIGGAGSIFGVKVGGSGVFGDAPAGGTGTSNQNFSGVLGLLNLAQILVTKAVPFLIGLGLLAFFWFLVEFIWKARESGDAQQKSKSGMFYSIAAIFVMVSIWGIINLIGVVTGIRQGGTIQGFILPGETK